MLMRDKVGDLDSPKHGKMDPDNAPHVGGNTWAGGTGGRDTAGKSHQNDGKFCILEGVTSYLSIKTCNYKMAFYFRAWWSWGTISIRCRTQCSPSF